MKKKTKPDKTLNGIVDTAIGILNALATHDESVGVTAERIGEVLAIDYRVHADDMPRVVGYGGRCIAAINVIMQAIGMRRGYERVVPTLLEPPVKSVVRPKPFVANPNWKAGPVSELLASTLKQILPRPFEIKWRHMATDSFFELRPHKEDGELLRIVLPALATLFGAIGKHQGRIIHLIGPDGLVAPEEPARRVVVDENAKTTFHP